MKDRFGFDWSNIQGTQFWRRPGIGRRLFFRHVASAVRWHMQDLLRAIEKRGKPVYDTVVFDPPRQGAEAQARELAKSNVKTVVAVSCDATTFARDARILIGGGYKLARVTAVDQFRYSFHVEMVGKFEK